MQTQHNISQTLAQNADLGLYEDAFGGWVVECRGKRVVYGSYAAAKRAFDKIRSSR